jgi:virginiamycin B lyase
MALRIVITLFCLTLIPVAVRAAEPALPEPTIQEWDVPWENTRPRDPYVGPSGNIWFVGQRGDYVAELDPASGDFRRIDLDDGTGPHNLIVAGDGTIYYAGNRAAHIGRIDPGSGAIHKIAMPDARARDPHTLAFDAAGDIYFTVQGGNMIGRLDVDREAVTLSAVPTESARPYGIIVAPSGTVWATAFGTNKLLRIDPETVAVSEIDLPRDGARPRRLQATSDGRIWYVDYAEGMLGFLHPPTNLFKEYAVPGGNESRPYGMAVDADDILWFVETGSSPNQLVGFDPVTESFTEPLPVPSGGGTVRHMVYDPARDAIWFGADTNTIGKADLSP